MLHFVRVPLPFLCDLHMCNSGAAARPTPACVDASAFFVPQKRDKRLRVMPPTHHLPPPHPPPFLRKDIMDKEWRRRQTLVGRFQYPHHNAYTMDERLAGFGPETL